MGEELAPGRLYRGALWSVCAAAPFVALGLTAPLLPVYYVQSGFSDGQVAQLWGIAALAVLATQQVWGYLADGRLGRKGVLILMTGASTAFALGFPFAEGFLAVAVAACLLESTTNSRLALVNALILGHQRGSQRFPALRALGSLAFVAGALGGGAMAGLFPGVGAGVIFPMVAGVNVLFIAALAMLPPQQKGGAAGGASFADVQRIIFSSPVARAFLLFILVYQIPHTFSAVMQSVLMTNLGATPFQSTMPLIIGALIEIPAFFLLAPLLRRQPITMVFLVCIVAQALRWGMIAVSPTVPVILASNALHLFSFGVTYMGSVLFIERELPAEYRASGQAVLQVCYVSIGMVLGPWLSALFLNFLSIAQWYGVATVLVLLSLPLWRRFKSLHDAAHGKRPSAAGAA